MFNERNQAFKTEFMMVQSCVRGKDEMLYKNINRKFLNFNLENHQQMAQVGKALKPFGFFQNLQHKAIGSKLELLRIWAETRLARRGSQYLRRLYRENPEKFFDVQFTAENTYNMELSQCKYILSDSTSQKTVSLLEDCCNEMQRIRELLLAKEKTFADEQKLAQEFSPEVIENPNLIGQMA